MNIYKLATA